VTAQWKTCNVTPSWDIVHSDVPILQPALMVLFAIMVNVSSVADPTMIALTILNAEITNVFLLVLPTLIVFQELSAPTEAAVLVALVI
jgi:high-affinity K+ transport system ATPase subunit B